MNDSEHPDGQRRRDVALFRYGLIAELLPLQPGTDGLYQRIQAIAAREHTIPASLRTRVAVETLRGWLRAYRAGGFDALMPKPRADRDRSRAIPDTLAEALLELKAEQPAWSIPALIARVREQHNVDPALRLAPATVHRLLTRAGLMRKTLGGANANDRRRFAYRYPGELWMSDVMHGPTVGGEGRQRRKAYLIAFIDDATRVVPFAAFALHENTQAFLPVLKQALMRRGRPARLFVDNGAAYRSRHLALVCAKLGIALIHARPFQPAGKGKIERFFRTVRAQLIAHLTPADTDSLEALNRRLWAYLEGEYHHTPHRALDGQTPLERWSTSAEHVRFVEPELDLEDLFLFDAVRRVNKDRTVSLNGVLYEVDAALVGDKVTLRFDPSAPPGRPVQVHHQGQLIESAKPLDAYANTRVKRVRPSNLIEPDSPPPTPPRGLALRELRRRDTQPNHREEPANDDADNRNDNPRAR